MDVHLGIERTHSNGNGDERHDNMHMVETIKNLQKDVQIHKYDNERLMRSKENKDEFNMKLLQSLNKIEKKLDKETGSSKSRSHRPPDEKQRTISVRKHHHHSLRNYNKRSYRRSITSPIRNHKGSVVDEL
jgi:hypothetical protein